MRKKNDNAGVASAVKTNAFPKKKKKEEEEEKKSLSGNGVFPLRKDR